MLPKLFDLDAYLEYAVVSFVSCPGILSLSWHGSMEDHTDIDCEDKNGQKHIFYVPYHVISVKECGINGRDYVFTKVCSVLHKPPDFWLITDYLRRTGHLFPIDVFSSRPETSNQKTSESA
ncbi:hypothetical protein K9M47_01235 [Candidatus Gracilibacteria bacterium]|nr:hypothetical protein [Candidatus Gracilibacteria bacterium]